MKQVVCKDDILYISFPYDPETVAQVKTLHGRKWNAESKMWSAPVTLTTFQKLKSWGFSFHIESSTVLQKLIDDGEKTLKKASLPSINVRGVKRPLLLYQKEFVAHAEAAKGRTILGDQQGLGKTASQLAWAQYRQDIRPVIVVCPSNAKWGYHSEAKYIMPQDTVHVVSGRYKRGGVLPLADVYVINYDILYLNATCETCKGKKKIIKNEEEKKCPTCKGRGILTYIRPDIKAVKAQALFIDECQYLQEVTSSRTTAVYQLAKDIKHIIPSSGTPIKHRPKNFFPVLHLVRPDLFPAFFPFAMKYCGAKRNNFGWEFNGSSNMNELHDILVAHRVLLRRTKAEVLPQLPKLVRTTVYLELTATNMKEYRKADEEFLDWLAVTNPDKLSGAENAEALVRINALKQLTARLKMKQCLEWIDNFLEGGEKLIVFAHHKKTVSLIKEALGPKTCVTVDGGTSDTQKRDAETRFQACVTCGIKKDKHDIEPGACRQYTPNETSVFLGTLAAKEALTLTAAQDVVFIEFWDSPKDHEQAEERCYGRVSDPHGATAWYLVAKDTIEEDILESQEHKRNVIDAIVDGKLDAVSESNIKDLLNRIKRRV